MIVRQRVEKDPSSDLITEVLTVSVPCDQRTGDKTHLYKKKYSQEKKYSQKKNIHIIDL